jgi:hypothetical protein
MWLPACASTTPPPREADIVAVVNAFYGARGQARLTFQGSDTAWVISQAEYDEGNPEKYINTQLMVLTRNAESAGDSPPGTTRGFSSACPTGFARGLRCDFVLEFRE